MILPNPDENHPLIIVDDEKADTMFFLRALKKSKIKNQSLVFHSGQELLDYLEQVRASTALMPAAILLDINMPKMSGFEVLQNMKLQSEFQTVPVVVMLTSSTAPVDKETARNLGCDLYKEKPDTIEEYVEFLNSLIA